MLALLPLGLLAACGGDDTATETIDITMLDNRFVPDRVSVPRGQPVAFRFINEGSVRHEAIVGDEAAQTEHHADMEERANADDDDGHGGGHGGSPKTVTVEPGEEATLTVTVDADDVLIGCHEVGHWEDGMRAAVVPR
jgi:uncharacterized cupredoxin-like copper-binding protein